ncbi:MAG: PAS domain S-box protein [Deltaproteobacteria bacterium]|nr:PAS domain S-box protein [Deltaproteobacteria bacterium]
MAQKLTYEELDKKSKELEKEVLTYKCAVDDFKIEHRQLLKIFLSIDEPVYISDPETYEILFVNEAIKKLWGDVIGFKCYRVLQGLDTPCPFCTNDQIFGEKAGRPYIWEFQNRRTGRTFHCIDKAIRWPGGRMVRFEMAIDITERKQTEQALRESEEQYRRIFESSVDGLIIFDSDGFVQDVNPSACTLHGYAAGEFIGLHGKRFIAPGFYHRFDSFLQTVSADQTFITKAVNIRKDSSPVEIEVRGVPIRLKGQPHLLGVVRDITAQTRAEKKIQFMNTILLTQQETSLDGILIVDEKGKTISFNRRFADLWDIPSGVLESRADERTLQSVSDKLADPEAFLARIKRLHEHRREKSHVEIELTDGRTFERYSAPVTGPEGKYYGRVWYFRDITEQKKREEALRESEERYRAVVEDMPAMICRFLPDGTLTFVNRAYGSFFGKKHAELIGQNFFQYIPEKYHKKVRNHTMVLDRETPMATHEHQVIATDGSLRWQEWTNRALFNEKGLLVEYQSIGRDITVAKLAQQEKAIMEKQLQQAQKMESIGTLAGGIAHDFNNILASVLGYTELALDKVKEGDHNVLDNLEIVLQAGHRAKDLVHQILQFSRHADTDFKPVDIGPIVDEALKFLRASLPATIEIKQNIQSVTEKVLADGSQIHQVVMNLCTNAFHAMQKQGGVLTVALFKQELITPVLCHGSRIAPGTYAVLMIEDTGYGMNNETLQRIFEPYFTTKAIGEGTGLGLAVSKGIVASHNGGIRVESTPGAGSVFTLYFPLITRPKEARNFELSPIKGGTERILFVDDETFFVEFGAKILSALGYDVITANEGLTALEIFTSQPNRFDLVVTDQTMPKMTGLELSRRLHAVRPDLPVIVCTGFSERINGKTANQIGVSHILYKPASRRDLAIAVRKVFDNG